MDFFEPQSMNKKKPCAAQANRAPSDAQTRLVRAMAAGLLAPGVAFQKHPTLPNAAVVKPAPPPPPTRRRPARR